VAASVNSSWNEARGETPFFLFHGRDPRTPLAVASGSLTCGPKRDLSRLNQRALIEQHRRSKERVDVHRRDVQYNEGDLVWLYTLPAHKKGELNAKYQPAWAGPYRIRAKVGLLNYRLVNRHTGKDLQASPHVQRLKPYHPRRPVDHPELSREAESFEWAQESYESRVTAPVDASTVPENAATAAESANITLDQTPLSQLFTTLHAAYHNLRKQNRPYTSKVWHSARDKILAELQRFAAIFPTTERRTYWSHCVRDIHSGDRLEAFLRAVILGFATAFDTEISFRRFLRQRAQREERLAAMRDAIMPQPKAS